MAVQDINFNPKPEKGISYSKITDNNGDWGSVPNSTYFYDKATSLPYYKDSTGAVLSVYGGSIMKIAISDSTGKYTAYDTFALALAAASSGDTIEVFSNITETSDITVTCVDGVNINFNGYTYTLNTTGTSNSFTVPINVSLEMFNGKIKRIGGTASLSNSVSISATGSGVLTLNSMILESDFGNASYLSSASRTVKGGDFVGESLGVYISNAKLENAKASANSGAGLQIQNNGTAINCYGFSTSSYGVYNNSSNAYSCIGRSTGDIGFYGAGGYNFDCKGYSNSSYGASITGANKCANIFGYSSGSAGVNILGNGTNITGHSTSSYGVRYSSGSGDHLVDDVKALSTAASGMYVLKNAGKVEFSNLSVSSIWNDAAGHALTVVGSDDDVTFSGGSLRVHNASANGLYSGSAKSCYFVGLKFRGCTVAINSNITNLQSNTPDIYGNVLIG